jgi:hypothetical protein
MSPLMMKTFVGIILLIHGLGHALMILAALDKPLSPTHSIKSWIITPILGPTPTVIIGICMAVVSLVGFMVAGFNLTGWLFADLDWQYFTQLAAIVSLMGLIVFWDAFPFFFPNKIGVIIVDLYMFVSITWLNWPSEL